MSIFLGISMVLLVLLCAFLCLVILIQRPRADQGLGAAIGGGGMMESTFGAESSNILSKITVWCSIIFFVASFGLYLGYIYIHRAELKASGSLPTIEVPAPAAVPAPTDAATPQGTPPTTDGAATLTVPLGEVTPAAPSDSPAAAAAPAEALTPPAAAPEAVDEPAPAPLTAPTPADAPPPAP